MSIWAVTLPIAGHAYVTVEADDEASAIQEALNTVTKDAIETWEALERIVQGNVVYADRPWEAEAVNETPEGQS